MGLFFVDLGKVQVVKVVPVGSGERSAQIITLMITMNMVKWFMLLHTTMWLHQLSDRSLCVLCKQNQYVLCAPKCALHASHLSWPSVLAMQAMQALGMCKCQAPMATAL